MQFQKTHLSDDALMIKIQLFDPQPRVRQSKLGQVSPQNTSGIFFLE